MLDAIRQTLEAEPTLSFALLFGSRARGDARPDSDIDLALSFVVPPSLDLLGRLVAQLEEVTRHRVDLTLLEEAPIPLAGRIFREGKAVLVRDPMAFTNRKTDAILDDIDFAPIVRECTRGILARAAHG